jgi:hypothetical protein
MFLLAAAFAGGAGGAAAGPSNNSTFCKTDVSNEQDVKRLIEHIRSA